MYSQGPVYVRRIWIVEVTLHSMHLTNFLQGKWILQNHVEIRRRDPSSRSVEHRLDAQLFSNIISPDRPPSRQ